jgi:hypothetical protein
MKDGRNLVLILNPIGRNAACANAARWRVQGRPSHLRRFFTTDGRGHSLRSSAIPKQSFSEPSVLADLWADSAAPSRGAAVTSPAQLGSYRSSLIVEKNGSPKVQVWNDSYSSITGLAITVDLSDDVNKGESRTYYDAYVNVGRELPIYPHQPREIPIFSVVGSESNR